MLELQNAILEMVARGAALPKVAERLCHEVEAIARDVICSVLEVDRAGILHPVAGPGLPDDYSAALDGTVIGPLVGSCGSAAYLRQPVAVIDIERDPRWEGFRELALPLGFRACWSSPITDGRGDVVGTFAFYYRECRGPTPLEEELVRTCVHLCSIAFAQRRWQAEQNRQAFHDAQTGLPNRAAFHAAVANLPCDKPGAWGLLLADLDNLKTVNDTFGHLAGDRLIEAAASGIANAVLPGRTFRVGGDEFAVLVQEDATPAHLEHLARRVLLSLDCAVECDGFVAVPRATIGGATLTSADAAPDSVRKNADLALYHAKENARGRYLGYCEGIESDITRRLEAIARVGAALREDRVRAFYQPVCRLDSGDTVGFEALCRIYEGDALLAAESFRDATSDPWIATALTERMLSLVASDMRQWLERAPHLDHVAINVCAADFLDGRLANQISNIFGAFQVPLSKVVLEVTETVSMGSVDQLVSNQISDIRKAGVRIALDDFGTGFASLTHLVTVPFDVLKIDRSFVGRLGHDRISGAIVEAVVHIARQLKVDVVAEGVELVEHAHLLGAAGCSLAQGYLFSEPLDAAAATAWLTNEQHLAPERLRLVRS